MRTPPGVKSLLERHRLHRLHHAHWAAAAEILHAMRWCRSFLGPGPLVDPDEAAPMLREYVTTFYYAVIAERPRQARVAVVIAGALALQIVVEGSAAAVSDRDMAYAAADRAAHCYPPERLSTAHEGRVHLRNRHQQFEDAVAVGNRDKALRAAFEIVAATIRFASELPVQQLGDHYAMEAMR